ncbi:DNA repair protein radc [Xylanibacter ruminicola]|uniref:DNA repair protein radc n=1 Tax=Xylanibacter ruminicola TaxID=839 RepID=A0A1M7FS54_XYLRU|nr:DNA repair protein RadC [Xylanibacter ruminicola]SFC50612.1 DNA repair protein radc [Xylanibacter ruminicola]SHM06770.1 DNA repair protein radc [Xylanibacter ruminicola]
MKKLVAWKEEPVMETSAGNEEMKNRTNMGRNEKPAIEEDIDKPIVKSERRPTKKDIDREEGRKGSERRRRESRYKEDGHRPSSSHRPESSSKSKPTEKGSTIRPYRSKRTSEWKEIMEHQDKMSKLEKSLHELYPTSKITVHENTEEEPISLYKKWSNGDIPVEKLLTDGVDQLSESELLAIIMGNGPKEFPTVDLMNYVLDDCANDLNRLAKKTVEELMCYRGIGKNRAISVVAACEFGKRFRKTAPEEKPILKDALAVGNYMIPQLEDLDVEEFWALFLNPKHEMLRRVRICRGEISEDATDPRNIMRFGVMYNATYIVTVHNHISGNPSPTKFDNMIAEKLTKAAEAVRMTLRDHIILADEQYFSFKDNKKL